MKNKKRFLSILAILSLSATSVNAFDVQKFEFPEVRIFVDGKILESDVKPKIINSRTYAPARAVFTALGADVEWKQDNGVAVIKRDENVVEIMNGSNVMLINDKTFIMDVSVILENDRMLVPVRAISEAFGDKVNWYDKSRLVEIISAKEIEKQKIKEYETSIRENLMNNKKTGTIYLENTADDFSDYTLSDSSAIFDVSLWERGKLDGENVVVEALDDNTPTYFTEKLGAGIYEFNMTIVNPNTWPQLILSAKDKKGYQLNDCYMIGFLKDYVELQKFIDGERTVIYGTDTVMTPLMGGAIDNRESQLYEYSKEMKVSVGCIPEEDGTRIVLKINDVTVINYVDTQKSRLSGEGFFGIYVGGEGFFKFSQIVN